MRPITAGMPAADRELLVRDLSAKRTVRTAVREARAITEVPTLGQILTGLPEIPVVAVVGERADRGEVKGRAAMVELFRQAMKSHPGGRYVGASDSGHFVPWQEPELVADAIWQVIRAVRGNDA